MKILFITSRYPLPPTGGDKLRSYQMIKHLMDKGHEVHLFSLSDRLPDEKRFATDEKVVILKKNESYLNCMLGLASKKPLQVWYFKSSIFRSAIEKAVLEGHYDLVFSHLLRTAEYAIDLKSVPKIIDLTDAISMNYERVSNRLLDDLSLKNVIYSFERKRVLSYEGEVISKFDRAILISQADRDYLGRHFDVSNVEVIPNGVDTGKFSYHDGDYDQYQLIFFGNMRYLPNIDAVLYFSEKIFPLIKKELPKAKFLIAGAEPGKKVMALAKRSDIIVTGFVGDLCEHIKHSAVSVAPMRYGAGMQNKILEAMSVGVPVVTTSLGHEGIDVVPGNEIFVEDTSEGFAARVIQLVKDRSLRKSVSLTGRSVIERKYTWERSLQKLDEIIRSV